MKAAGVLVALAGISTGAAAQSLVVDISFADATVGIGETTTATMMASFTVAGSVGGYLAVADFNLIGNDRDFIASDLISNTWASSGTPRGSISGSGIMDFYTGQSAMFGSTDNSSPIIIAQWTILRVGDGSMQYQVESAGAPFFFGVMDLAGGILAEPTEYGAEVVTGGFIPAIPATATLGVFGGGIALVGRRRRN